LSYDQGTQLLGKKADELKRLKDENRPAYDAVVQRATWRPMLYRLRAKMETYNDQSRFKGAIMSATPINFATEGKLLWPTSRSTSCRPPTSRRPPSHRSRPSRSSSSRSARSAKRR